MRLLNYIFLISFLIIFYNYIGYAIIAFFLNLIKRLFRERKAHTEQDLSVSFIVACYNEELCIEEKIINSLAQNYPATHIEYIFITDGSSDKTNEIISRYPVIQLLYKPERQGKSAAVHRAVHEARNKILIFSDANAMLNVDATARIANHYNDLRVGGVAGEKKILQSDTGKDQVGTGEGLYWRYESFLKKVDSEFYSVVGAAGELFSIRKDLYEPLASNVVLDDFVLSLKVAQNGYRIVYEPGAFASELPSASFKDEKKRKVRISAGGFQAMSILIPLLRFWKHPRLSFLYISHRVLRWTLSPLCLILFLISNIMLVQLSDNNVYKVLLLIQIVFYGLAFIANYLPSEKTYLKVLKLPYYLVFMNISVIQGFFRYIKGNQPGAWEKAKRATA